MTKKISNFVRYFALSLVLMTSLILAPILEASAEGGTTDVTAYVSGDDISGASSSYAEGISPTKSGYMVYLVDEHGNAVSPDAKFVSSSSYGFTRGSSSQWLARSRLGGYSINESTAVARYNVPWEAPFTFSGGFATREAEIKAWMADDSERAGVTNAQTVIQGYWGDSYAEAWVHNNYYLVLEPIYEYRMWYKYNLKVIVSGHLTSEGDFQSRNGAPILVGNVPGLANMSNAFLSSLENTAFSPTTGVTLLKTYNTSFTASGMSSGYAKAFPRMEYLTKTIGSVRAGSEGTGYLTLSQINSAGWGMMALCARDLGDIEPPTDTGSDDTTTSDYDGTVYTLTATGGSSSSGSGSSATTYFGNGSGNCLSGSLYAENCASGTDAYNLADSMKRGMSYDGDVPPVVFSGTSYDLSVDSSLGIVAGMLTVDPSTFPYVDISSTDASGYSSYLSVIKSGIEPSIDRCYDGRVSGTYYDGTMDCSSVIGGASANSDYNLEVYCTLTKANCGASSSSSPTWTVGGDITGLSTQFAKVYYNYGSASSSSGRTLLEGTDLWRAFDTSWRQYVSNLQSSGKLEAYWRSKVEEDKVRVGNTASNNAYNAWLPTHPNPSLTPPTREEGLSEEEWEASDTYTDWLEECEAWQAEADRIKREARETAIAGYNESSFSCNFATSMSSSVAGISSQRWKFKLYWCSPIMQESYLVDDKIPIDDGPARGSKLFDEAWRVRFNYSLANNAYLSSDVVNHMITYLPFSSGVKSLVGSVIFSDIEYFVQSNNVPKTDFLLPDATSMDMR